MDNSKLTLKKASTAFGHTVLDGLEKGKGNTSLEPSKFQEMQKTIIASAQIDELLKEALRDDEAKKEKLAKRRAKNNQKKAKKPKLTEPEILRHQISLLTKSNNELKKQISSLLNNTAHQNRTNLLARALREIEALGAKNSTLEKENKALREIIAKNILKSLDPKREVAFYGGQYCDAQT
ncbi:hypothetical protein [Pseudomonas lopnurensis]|uniref:hypothetical protein n=1 Tax=Pseudomonas lopnurensis TaxID=1477517 RepID=UPI0028AEED67|nr:hypothetical protein [Pseudomonas lopnurensis]